MAKEIGILIVDDQPRGRQSLKALISSRFPGASLFEATNGTEAVKLVEQEHPKLVLIDARMPEMGGVEATLELKTKWPETRVIVLSMYPEYKDPALKAGADVFLSKGEDPEELLKTLAGITDQLSGVPAETADTGDKPEIKPAAE